MPDNNEYHWWQSGVIYQIYPRSFMDANGDGIGDLAGITQRLDYLSATLGIDAIWLSPFYPSPMADFGYDVADYIDIDPVFGDMDDFDQLIKGAHDRGLKVIIDYVPNHSSDQHAWFIESSSSRDNPKRDWYTWRDARPDGSPPNNWLSVFGGSAWEWHPPTGQYYLHSFLKEQPDLNWRDPHLKEAMFDVLRFWLDREIDGFRIDVAHFLMKDPQLRDNPLKKTLGSDFHKPLGDYDSQVLLHSQNHGDIHPLYREIRQLLDEYSTVRPRVSIGEIHMFEWDKWAQYYGQDLDELHMPMNFQLLGVDLQAEKVRQVVDSLERAMPSGAWPNYVLGNHDETRIASRYGEAGARLATMLLLTLRGTPTLYYGDEIGMQEASISPEDQQDPWGIRVPGLGRDGCRTPMQWNNQPQAGFSPNDASSPWLPINKNFKQANVDIQLREPGSILNLYRQLLALRKSSPALQVGSYTQIEDVHEGCFAYRRTLSGSPGYVILLNFSAQDLTLNTGESGDGIIKLSTYLDREENVDFAQLSLRKHEGVIVESSGKGILPG
jgi:glycosidase